MAHLPPTLNFAKTEEDVCATWAAEDTFKKQDALSAERGDEVSSSGSAAPPAEDAGGASVPSGAVPRIAARPPTSVVPARHRPPGGGDVGPAERDRVWPPASRAGR